MTCSVLTMRPLFSTIKRENRKGVQFVPGVHQPIFAEVARIYKLAKEAHGINGPVPVIVAQDETKGKARVTWDSRSDVLLGFCGTKLDHVCISTFRPVVGSGEEGYNAVVDAFQTNQMRGFAKIVVVNPMHEKLPRLVLVVSCTC